MNQPAVTQPIQAGSDEKTFHVALNGVLPNVSFAEAKTKLATLFKASEAQIETLLATPGHIVKRSCAPDIAAKYKAAIERAGGACTLIADEEPEAFLEVELPKAVPPMGVANPSAGSAQTPPKPQPKSLFQLRPTETVLFEGDLTRINSTFSIRQGDGLVSNERFVYQAGSDVFSVDKSDLAEVEEAKHGLSAKFVVKRHDGTSIAVTAANSRGFKNALYSLAGKPIDASALAQPELNAVKNNTAWLAAFAPLIGGFVVSLFSGNPEYWGIFAVLKFEFWVLAFVYTFMRIDHLMLQQQGFNPASLAILPPEKFFFYLDSRAKAFGHARSYNIAWFITLGIHVLGLLLVLIGIAAS